MTEPEPRPISIEGPNNVKRALVKVILTPEGTRLQTITIARYDGWRLAELAGCPEMSDDEVQERAEKWLDRFNGKLQDALSDSEIGGRGDTFTAAKRMAAGTASETDRKEFLEDVEKAITEGHEGFFEKLEKIATGKDAPTFNERKAAAALVYFLHCIRKNRRLKKEEAVEAYRNFTGEYHPDFPQSGEIHRAYRAVGCFSS